jgi:FkbM family methyltransferase
MNNIIENFNVKYTEEINIGFKIGWSELIGFYQTQELETKKFFCEIISSNWNIIDVGANIGMYSLLFKKLTNGNIFLIEGSEVNFDMLKTNLNGDLDKKVHLFNECVSDKDILIENSTIHYLWTGRGSVLQKTGNLNFKKIDTLLNNFEEKIDLIKIDVDGWDFESLKGCENILNQYSPIICIELVEEA